MPMKTNQQEEEGKRAVYEIGCLFVPTISDKEVLTEVSNVKSFLEKLGFEFLSGAGPNLLELAYSMKKVIENEKHSFNGAYFVWLKFKALSEKLSDFKKDLDKNNNLLRYLLMKTTEEDSLVSSQKKVLTNVAEEKEKNKKELKPVKIAKIALAEEENSLPEITEKEAEEEKDLDETIDKLVIK